MPTEAFLCEWYQRYDVLGRREPYYQALASADPWHTPEGFEIAMRFALVKRTLKHRTSNLKCLDVGSGQGLFLDLLKRAGWQGIGIELNAEAAVRARERFGVEVRVGAIESVDLPADSFDAVTLWDIFEHVRDPLSMISRAHDFLKPNGYIFIETPNVRSMLDWVVRFLARLGIKGPAVMFYGLHHLTLWDPKTVRRVLAERGFTTPDIRFAHTSGSRVFRGKTFRDMATRAGVWVVQALGVLFGKQNKMIIIAKRVN